MKENKTVSKRFHQLFLFVMLLTMMLGLFNGRSASGQEEDPQGWNVILLIDQSGSMFKTNDPCSGSPDENDIAQSDRLPLRQEAAKRFIDFLGVDPSGRDQVGVIYFGTDPQLEKQLFPTTDQTQSEAAKAILGQDNCPPDLEWTNINKALESAYNELNNLQDTRDGIVILLTDGKPELASPWSLNDTDVQGKESYYERHFELLDQYRAADIQLFVIALGSTAQLLGDPYLAESGNVPTGARSYRDLWSHAAGITGGEYYKVESNDQLWTTYHAIAAKLARVFPGELIVGNKEDDGTLNENFEVPDAARMVITVERNVNTQSFLLDPAGDTQPPIRSDQYYDIYNFTNPMPGRWTLRFQGAPTRYTVLIDYKIADLNIEVENLPQIHPVSKPLPLRVRITDDDGMPLDDVLAGLTIIGDGAEDFLSLAPVTDAPGLYEGQWTNTHQIGDYDLIFQANQGDRKTELEERLTLDSLLFIETIMPQENEFVREAAAQFILRRGADPVMVDPDKTQIIVQLLDANNNEIGMQSLSDISLETADNSYTARFEDIPEGDYTFKIMLDAPEEGISDENIVPFRLRLDIPILPGVPKCLQNDFGTFENRLGQSFQLVAPMDTSELDRPAVVNATLEMADTAAPIDLTTTRLTVAEGLPSTPAELNIAIDSEAETLFPGLNSFVGIVTFNVEDQAPFCTMDVTIDVIKERFSLVNTNLNGRPGEAVAFNVSYDTSGQTTTEPVSVSLAGVPTDMITINVDDATLTPPSGELGNLELPIQINNDVEPELYQGQIIFHYSDGNQDTAAFSLSVAPPLWRGWPWLIGLLLLSAIAGGIVYVDPFCLRCKLTGALVFMNMAQPDIPLAGRRQVVNLGNQGQTTSGSNPVAQLIIQARKNQAPVIAVKSADDRVWIEGQAYDKGAKNIQLRPDATIEAGSVELKYEALIPFESTTFGSTVWGEGGLEY